MKLLPLESGFPVVDLPEDIADVEFIVTGFRCRRGVEWAYGYLPAKYEVVIPCQSHQR